MITVEVRLIGKQTPVVHTCTQRPPSVLVYLSNYSNYKFQCTIEISSSNTTVVQAVLDTGAGPNLMHGEALPSQCMNDISK